MPDIQVSRRALVLGALALALALALANRVLRDAGTAYEAPAPHASAAAPACRGRWSSSTSSAPFGAPGLYRLPQGSRIADARRARGRRDAEGRARPRQPRRAARRRSADRRAGAHGRRCRRRRRRAVRARRAGAPEHARRSKQTSTRCPGVGPGDGAEDPRLPAAARRVRAASTSSTRSPASARSASTSSASWWRRDRPRAARARRRAVPRAGGRRTPRACRRSRLAAGAVGAGRPRRRRPAGSIVSPSLAAALALRRLVVGQRAPRRARPQRPRRCGRHGGTRPARGDGAGAAEPLPAARPGRRSALRRASGARGGAARAAAGSRAAAGRAPVRRSSPSSSRAGPTTASTSGPGSRRKGIHVVLRADRWRARRHARRVSARSPTACARTSRRSLARGASGERGAVLAGVVLGDDQAVVADAARPASARRGSTTCWPCPGRTSRSSPSACSSSPPCSACRACSRRSCALAGIAAYVLAVGAQPSVVRAGIVGALGSLAWLAARQRDRWHFLLLAALVLLAWNPYTLLDAGFQLSFAAVAAIFVLVRPLMRILEGYPLPRWLREAIAVSTACSVATAPVLWLQFHAVPLLAVPANALAAPAMAPLLGARALGGAARPVSPGAAARPRRPRRLVRRLARAVRARDRRPAVRPGQLDARRRRARSLRPPRRGLCLAAMAQLKPVYLISGQRPAEDPPRARAAPQPLRGGRGRGSRAPTSIPPTTPSPPATRSASSAASGGSSSSRTSTRGRRPTRRSSRST